MFTGIIQHVGVVESVSKTESGIRLSVDPALWTHLPKPGDSIANNGCCLTIVEPVKESGGRYTFDAIPETIEKTTLGAWKPGMRVNLERALRMGDTLDGHQVQGHVDGTGEVKLLSTDEGWRMRVGLDEELIRFMIPKGSVCIDGISLTIAALDPDEHWIEVAIIPETLERTNLGDRMVGDTVNIEADILVKTVVHTMGMMNSVSSS